MTLSAQQRLDRITKELTLWQDQSIKGANRFLKLSLLPDDKRRYWDGGDSNRPPSQEECLQRAIECRHHAKAYKQALRFIEATNTFRA